MSAPNSPKVAAAPAEEVVSASDAQADSSSSQQQQSQPQPFHTASLYVGDIHPDVTEALLFEIFNAVGPVASIRVCRDAVTRRSLGYAYVNFHNVADAERALDTMNYMNIKSVPCRIMWSQRDPSLRKSGVGNIFVKNLDVSIDNKALYDTFSLFGNILSCKVAIDHSHGGSKGYGYVHYETQEAANEAIEKINGMLIAGKEVFVGTFQRRSDRPDLIDWTNCYVKNMPRSWTDADMLKEFSPFGEISSCVVMKPDENTVMPNGEKNRGFGFVNFDHPESAQNAMEALNGKVFREKVMETKENETTGESEQVEKEMEYLLYVGKAQKRNERERELRGRFDAMKMDRITKYQGVNLYVKNLDDQVSDDDLREMFAGCGTITSCRIMRDQNEHSRGFGFVCFATPEEATKAVTEMNGKLISGKPIYVALAQRKEVRRAQLEAQHQQQRNIMHPHNIMAMGMGGQPMHHVHNVQAAAAAAAVAARMAGQGMHQGMQPPMYGGPGPAGSPMFYAQPGQMQQHQRGQMMPQQMMGRGGAGARGGVAGYPRQGGNFPPQMGGYGGPNMQMQRGGRRQHGGRQPNNYHHPGSMNGGRGNGPQGQHPGNRNFKYTANVRNQRENQQQQPPQPMENEQQPPPVPAGNPFSEPLTSEALANASPAQQKNMIGERLYPLIHREQPELAGKITGMLLEMDNGELLHLLESPEALLAKILEAIQVLEAHTGEEAE